MPTSPSASIGRQSISALGELLGVYAASPQTQALQAALAQAGYAQASGTPGSLKPLIVSAIFHAKPTHVLFIGTDLESAQYFQNDLQTFLDGKTVRLFPSPYKREEELKEANNQAILERTEVLTHLGSPGRAQQITVTYPEALFEKVIRQNVIRKNTFEVKTGEKLDLDFVIDFLVSYNFERTDFVYEPGTFSIRGGIVDIFSFANELPYRLELFDDTVESIRAFDPETQLSVRKLAHTTIIPNLESGADGDSLITLLEFISPETLIVFTDGGFTMEVLEKLWRKAQATQDDPKRPEHWPGLDAFYTPKALKTALKKFRVLDFGTRKVFPPIEIVVYDAVPQPSFNRNFQLLGNTLIQNETAGLQTIVFSDQTRQIERIYAIFDDIGIKAGFTPIYKVMHEGFIHPQMNLALFTEHQIFGRYQRYKGRSGYARKDSITLKELYELKPGDYITHIDYGVGIFSGLEKVDANGTQQEAIRIKYKGGDLLYVNIHSLHKITRFVGQEGKAPQLNKLGTATWDNLKAKTKKKVKDIARDLIQLYAKRKAVEGFQFSPDNYLQTELEASFIYEDTPDQARTTEEVKKDMMSPHPMDRLVCGDVGFGKTEIAIRAAFKAAVDGKQVAVLVPTTVLALQHYKTFAARLADFPLTVDFVSRFKNAAQIKETLKKTEAGKIDILIGTHRLLSADVKWKDLGLMIVDEEQKFGVTSKEKLRGLRANVDTLTLTATPIPRTMQFSLMGARDMSIINTPPPNRQPVKTMLEVFDKDIIQQALEREIERGGQVFFVHNRVKTIYEMGDMVRALVPHARVAVAHAQMEPKPLEELMVAFVEGFYDVLVSTNIVESGLDIPNANTIIIDNAQNFGLSDLYQLRGRVGRSNRKAYCYLLTPSLSGMTPEARKRLSAIEEFSDLGSGFQIAMRDLDIRGAGNLLGAEQSGFIAEIGLEMFTKIINEAMGELRDEEFADLFADQPHNPVEETQLDTDLEILLPDRYVTSVNERLGLYTRINDLDSLEQLEAFQQELIDRFGPIPRQTQALLDAVRLKWLGKTLCMDKLSLKRRKLKAEFSPKGGDRFYGGEIFGRVLAWVHAHPTRASLRQKEKELILEISDISSVGDALKVMQGMLGNA